MNAAVIVLLSVLVWCSFWNGVFLFSALGYLKDIRRALMYKPAPSHKKQEQNRSISNLFYPEE